MPKEKPAVEISLNRTALNALRLAAAEGKRATLFVVEEGTAPPGPCAPCVYVPEGTHRIGGPAVNEIAGTPGALTSFVYTFGTHHKGRRKLQNAGQWFNLCRLAEEGAVWGVELTTHVKHMRALDRFFEKDKKEANEDTADAVKYFRGLGSSMRTLFETLA